MENKVIKEYDFSKLGLAIKYARKNRGLTRNKLAECVNISPRYLAEIENNGQQPSLQILYSIVTYLNLSVDEYFFNNNTVERNLQRRQLDELLNDIGTTGLQIIAAVAQEVKKAEQNGNIK